MRTGRFARRSAIGVWLSAQADTHTGEKWLTFRPAATWRVRQLST